TDAKRFVSDVVGFSEFNHETLNGMIKPHINKLLADVLMKKIETDKVPLQLLSVKTDAVGTETREALNNYIGGYGLEITGFTVDNISLPS
ncbi:MAG TPA: SPFH domain-containing protein, partial [Flavobacteriales bacterium]|nr:SPFH domain-containing protein [Flavobacteriales bacterium]